MSRCDHTHQHVERCYQAGRRDERFAAIDVVAEFLATERARLAAEGAGSSGYLDGIERVAELLGARP